MRRKLSFLALCIAFFTTGTACVAQQTSYFTEYFDSRVREKTPQQRYYTVGDNVVEITDRSKGIDCLTGTIRGTTDTELVDAYVRYVRNNGVEYFYKQEFRRLSGTFTNYDSDTRQPASKLVTRDKQIMYGQMYDAGGHEALTHGTGHYTCIADDKTYSQHVVVQDSVIKHHYNVRIPKGDTLYVKVDKMASPVGGLQQFTQDLVRTVKYPTLARFVGKEGRAYIRFIVDEKGKLTEFEPVSNEGYRFETKVIRQLESFPDWNPAREGGRPVKMAFVLPVVYKMK